MSESHPAVGAPVQPSVRPLPDRAAFELYFAASRRNRGPSKRPTFARLGDGTYADDHTQRHWWTWQQAMERAATTIEQQATNGDHVGGWFELLARKIRGLAA